MRQVQTEHLLKSRGFSLNVYQDSICWEFEVTSDEELKKKICDIFRANIELYVDGTDINILVLQCRNDFSKPIFFYDRNIFEMKTKDFLECVN